MLRTHSPARRADLESGRCFRPGPQGFCWQSIPHWKLLAAFDRTTRCEYRGHDAQREKPKAGSYRNLTSISHPAIRCRAFRTCTTSTNSRHVLRQKRINKVDGRRKALSIYPEWMRSFGQHDRLDRGLVLIDELSELRRLNVRLTRPADESTGSVLRQSRSRSRSCLSSGQCRQRCHRKGSY